jgi:hypothetical protein
MVLQRRAKGSCSRERGVRRRLGGSTDPNGASEDAITLGVGQGQIGLLHARLPATSTTVTRP